MVELRGTHKASHEDEALGFTDVVGQSELKRALLAVGANGDLGGLLVRGEKGTAKSTAVRALADILPSQRVVADCELGCPPDEPARQCADCRDRTDPPTTERAVPLVTLPLGATRDRVVGTLSVADALDGDHEFEPGLLARANRGILYVDEVNLLDDHLVDVLLDAAASGVNRVERDGVSVTHPAEVTLVGTMNPEEGDLRPQLRDRFALQATVTGCEDLDDRVAIIDQALGREDEATSGTDDGRTTADRRDQLHRAMERLRDVDLPPEFAREIAELCRDADLDGHRGDIATARTARTLAALDDRGTVLEIDVREAAALALPHRLQSRPFEDAADPEELLDEHFDRDEGGESGEGSEGEGADGNGSSTESGEDSDRGADSDEGDGGDGAEGDEATGSGGEDGPGEGEEGSDGDRPAAPQGPRDDAGEADGGSADPSKATDEGGSREDDGTGPDQESDDGGDQSEAEPAEAAPLIPGQSRAEVGTADAPTLDVPDVGADAEGATAGGARGSSGSTSDGPRLRTKPATDDGDVDVAASVRAAAGRGSKSVESRDLRESVRATDTTALVLFVVDASASMRPAMRAAKGTVLELLRDAYQQRDAVGFVAFAGEEASVLLPPTDSVTHAARHLKDLPTGDRTPLPDALRTASEVVERAAPAASVVVLVSDGRANVATGSPVEQTREAARRLRGTGSHVLVVDAGDGTRAGLTGLVTEETGGECIPLDALSAETVEERVGAGSR